MHDQTIEKNLNTFGISGNVLKILGAIFMLIDHVGVILFPNVKVLRIIGRLAFPIFAFMIAEGCRYTKNKLRYFLTIFILGFMCQVVYYLYDKQLKMSILITFSLSILAVYSLQFVKESLFNKKYGVFVKILSIIAFIAVIAGIYYLNQIFSIDYGFWGCLTPLFASLLVKPNNVNFKVWDVIDNKFTRLIIFGIGLIILAIEMGKNQIYSLLSLLILFLYSGKKGKANLKYFFYVFYPLHLVCLECLAMLM
ncbi:MAG: hypothetical protein IJW26_05470 [Clostridia bacterium]|nr:hypothetical protein [Clostridia bacterium]